MYIGEYVCLSRIYGYSVYNQFCDMISFVRNDVVMDTVTTVHRCHIRWCDGAMFRSGQYRNSIFRDSKCGGKGMIL